MPRAAIALGSNLGDRRATLARAVDLLRPLALGPLAVSPIHETAPVAVTAADPGGPYLNAAATFDTTLDPHALLAALHDIERRLGRDRATQPHGSPRTLDLDLLLLGDLILSTPALTLPHPRLHERLFVLVPLAEIAPDLIVPTLRVSIATLLARVFSSAPPAPPHQGAHA